MIISNLDPTLTAKHFFTSTNKSTISRLKSLVMNHFNVKSVFFYDSGRSALASGLIALSALNKSKTEVIVSGYTCVVVVNAILKAGLKPIYVDINTENLGLNQKDLATKITANTLAIIVQHTFGIYDDIFELKKIAEQNNAYLIEDLAHTLAVQKIHGDLAFLSFGSNKVITSSRGGALLTNNLDLEITLKNYYKGLLEYSNLQVFKHVFKSICFYSFYPIYNIGGRYMLALLYTIGLFPNVITKSEKAGKINDIQILKLHPKLATFALVSFLNLENNLRHRAKTSTLYLKKLNPKILLQNYTSLPMIFFPILVSDPQEFANKLKKYNIALSIEWSFTNIVPSNANHNMLNYPLNSCPNAENIAKQIINLPTHIHITEKRAYKIINTINKLI
jgi:dTDP-4-amino-4,6-dideoxygalactose transaminase